MTVLSMLTVWLMLTVLLNVTLTVMLAVAYSVTGKWPGYVIVKIES